MMCQRIGISADLDHRLRPDLSFLGQPRAVPACKYCDLHAPVSRCQCRGPRATGPERVSREGKLNSLFKMSDQEPTRVSAVSTVGAALHADYRLTGYSSAGGHPTFEVEARRETGRSNLSSEHTQLLASPDRVAPRQYPRKAE